MTDDTTDQPPGPAGVTSLAATRSAAEVAALLDAAAAEDEALQLLDGGMARLRQVQQARAALAAMSTEQLSAALRLRRAQATDVDR